MQVDLSAASTSAMVLLANTNCMFSGVRILEIVHPQTLASTVLMYMYM
jgi:hypothetical protein